MSANSIIGVPLADLVQNGTLKENIQSIAGTSKSLYTQMIEIVKLFDLVYSPDTDFESEFTIHVNVGAIQDVILKNGNICITYSLGSFSKAIKFKLTTVDYTIYNNIKEGVETLILSAFYEEDDAEPLEDDPEYGVGAYAFYHDGIFKMLDDFQWHRITDNIDDKYVLVYNDNLYTYENGYISILGQYDDTIIKRDINELKEDADSLDHRLSDLEHAVESIEGGGLTIPIDSTLDAESNNPVKNSTLYRVIRDLDERKQEALRSGTNIKTINGQSILGQGNVNIAISAVIVISYAGEDPQQKDGIWLANQIFYSTSNGAFYVCTNTGNLPETEITIPDGSILFVEQPDNLFYYYNNQIDGEPIPFTKPVDDSLSPTSHNAIENAIVTQRFLQKQENLDAKNGIIIRSKEEGEISSANYIIELNAEQLDLIVSRLVSIDRLTRKVDAIWDELHPTPEPDEDPDPDPTPQPRIFDRTVGNWGDIHFDDDPQDITVADIMDEEYDIPLIADPDDENIAIWDSGETPPEGPYFITAEKAGLAKVSGDPVYSVAQRAYLNRKALIDITSGTGDYENCVGLILGNSSNNEKGFYYIYPIPGDGNDIVYGNVHVTTYDEGWDGTHEGDKGIVFKKDFVIIGTTFDGNGNPTSGLTFGGNSSNLCPLIYTTHSLNLIGLRLAQRYSGYGLVVCDAVDGIDQVQIKDCYFCKVNGDGDEQYTNNTTKYVIFQGRGEDAVDVYGVLREDNCIKNLLIYNNTFKGSSSISNGAGLSTSISNRSATRYLDSCRIVNNVFDDVATYPFNWGIVNGSSYQRTTAFAQCPIYIAGNEINGLARIRREEGSQVCGIYLEHGRTYILHNTIRNIAVSRSDSTSTYFAYASCSALYFCNNTCEDIIKVSSNRGNIGLMLNKNLQIPGALVESNDHYDNELYIVGNTFKQNLSTLKQWWDAWIASSSAPAGDASLSFDECCSLSIMPSTEDEYIDGFKNVVVKDNVYNLRGIRTMADGSPTTGKHFVIEGNTFNFGQIYYYIDSTTQQPTLDSHIFNFKGALDISITDNKFVTEVSPLNLLNIKAVASSGYITPNANITFDGNGVLTGVTFKKRRGSGNSTSFTNTNQYIVSSITPEEQAIIDGDTTPIS